MAQYSAAFSTLPIKNSIVAPLFDIRPSATDYPRITEINLYAINPTALTLTVGLGLSATVGTARTSSIVFVPYNPSLVPIDIVVATDWSILPTVPTQFFRRAVIASASTPGKATFMLPGGLLLAPSTALSMWITSTGAVPLTPINMDVEIEIDV